MQNTEELFIDEANLGKELAEHCSKLVFAAQKAIDAQLAHDQFKFKVDELAAIIDRDTRATYEAAGKKFTEKVIDAAVITHADYKAAMNKLYQLKAQVELFKARRDAWRERGSMLVQMSSNKRSEMEALTFDTVKQHAISA